MRAEMSRIYGVIRAFSIVCFALSFLALCFAFPAAIEKGGMWQAVGVSLGMFLLGAILFAFADMGCRMTQIVTELDQLNWQLAQVTTHVKEPGTNGESSGRPQTEKKT